MVRGVTSEQGRAAERLLRQFLGVCLFMVYASWFTEMCSGSEEGSYLRLIDFVYHSTLGLIVIKKKEVTSEQGGVAERLLRQFVAQRFRGGLVFKAQRLFVSLNSRLESNKTEKKV